MPLYEYECENCGNRFEQIQKFSDPPTEVCPKCGKGPVRKLLSSPAIQFKGTGWYVTDYARKNGGSGASESAAGKNDGGQAKDASSGEAKTESKTDAKTESKTESKPATP